MLSDIDAEVALAQVVSIGEEFSLFLADYSDVHCFVNRLMDRLEGRRSCVSQMAFVVAYRQQFLLGVT